MRLLLTLSLWCLIVHQSPAFDPAEFLVGEGLKEVIPAFAEFDGDMYAGMLPIDIEPNEKRGELMFWLFQPNVAKAKDTLTIWLNGGPGCSSLFTGVLFECSPVTSPHYPAGYPRTRYDESLVANEWAWTKATNMLFVEQPTGVGLSHGPRPETEADVAADFYNFLVNFYNAFPEMKFKRLFAFGESYAGYYVPSIALKIHRENQKKDEKTTMNLAGIGIGNGWMDALVQGPMVIDYAWWHGMIDSTTKDEFHAMWEDCKAGMDMDMDPPFHKFTVPDECNFMGATLAAAGAGIFPDMSPNTYDVTTWDPYPILKHPNSTYVQFYNNLKVRKALHAPLEPDWVGCIAGAGRRTEEEEQFPGRFYLANDKPESVVPYVAELLDEAGIRVLIYNGDRDMSACAQGSEMLLDRMEWSGADAWKTADRGLWMVHDEVAGYAKSYANLDFVVVYNSGHLVPNNVPIPALDLITRFVTDQVYGDIPLPRFSKPAKTTIVQALVMSRSRLFPPANILLFVVAVGCFSSGVLAASWINKNKKHGYTRIGDVTKGNIEDSSNA